MFIIKAAYVVVRLFLSAVVLSPLANAATSQKCESVRPESSTDQQALIRSSGRHCVQADFNQGWLYVLSEGGRRGPHDTKLVEIWASQVDLDLKNHTLRTSTYIDGIVGPPNTFDPRTLARLSHEQVHRLFVHDGTIRLHNSDGGSSGIGVISPLEISYIHNTHTGRTPPSSFAKVDFVLENLTINTGNAAAVLMGDGIVVRNCIIEVEGPNALVIYGPNAIVENNRIVYRYVPVTVRGLAEPTPERAPEVRAAIYLRMANGAVIRGNTIEVRGAAGDVSAVALIDSTSVHIENNQLSRTAPVATLLGRSSAHVRRNRSISGPFNPATLIPDSDLNSESSQAK